MSFNPSDQYNIIQKIGEGGMGTVYLAEDKLIQRLVAIKSLNKSVTNSSESMEGRFQQEALALAKLNHANITHLYAFIPRNESYWMVMEYVEGNTLENWLKQKGKISSLLACSIAVQILDGLDHAHKKGIIHRDLKPANIMVSAEGEVKIMDFGIARIRNSQRLTQHGKSVGTLEYMAPEQIQGKEGDELTDVYAVGNILYELLTGHTPFSSDTDYQLMKRKLEEKAPVTSSLAQAATPALQKIVATALERNPQKRYTSVRLFKDALLKSVNYAVFQEQQLIHALQTDRPVHTGEHKLAVTGEMEPPKLKLSPSAIGHLFSKYMLRLKWPANVRLPGFAGWFKNKPGWMQDKAILTLVIIAFACLCLILGNTLINRNNNDIIVGPGTLPPENTNPEKMIQQETNPPKDIVAQKDNNVINANIIVPPPAGNKEKNIPVEPKPKDTKPKEKKKDDNNVITPKEQEPPKPPKEDKTVINDKPVKVPAGRTVKVILDQTLSSEERSKDGSAVRLHIAEAIIVDGKTIIRAGAPGYRQNC
jgi:serine/threonine protein kinase